MTIIPKETVSNELHANAVVDSGTDYGSQSSSQLEDVDVARREMDIAQYSGDIFYSKRYNDELYEYRHVILPKELCKYHKADRLLSESEWRSLGVQQSPGWIHYMIHKPEPHILLFRRELALSTESQPAPK